MEAAYADCAVAMFFLGCGIFRYADHQTEILGIEVASRHRDAETGAVPALSGHAWVVLINA